MKPKAVISVTNDVNYLPFLPFAIYSWNKLGASVIVIVDEETSNSKQFNFLTQVVDLDFEIMTFSCMPNETVTYSQVGRLFGAINQLDETVLITSDVDMCVFDESLLNDPFESIVVTGIDLPSSDLSQIPMCYTSMRAANWKKVFSINQSISLSENISLALNPRKPIDRAEEWFFDQLYLSKKVLESKIPLVGVERRLNDTHRIATRRADRDGWPNDMSFDNIIDAHLPRPITDHENFLKIKRLFELKYSSHDLAWISNVKLFLNKDF